MKILLSIIFLLSLIQVDAQVNVIKSKTKHTNGSVRPNEPPIVDAGPDKAVTLPTDAATLFGSGSDSRGSVIFLWVQISGPSTAALTGAGTNTLLAGTLIEGSYLFELSATDDSGLVARDTAIVVVNPSLNELPIAGAGVDKFITLPLSSVATTGTATDGDGTIQSTIWVQIGTAPSLAVITSATTLTPVFSSLVEGTYNFQLTVTDNRGGTSSDIMRVIVSPLVPPVNQPPVADAGFNITVSLPTTSTTLNGSGTDPDGTITNYDWSLIQGSGGSITSPTSAVTNVTGLTAGVRVYQLIVTDNLGLKDTAVVQVTVIGSTNTNPTANAGPDKAKTLPNDTVMVVGSGSDIDGAVVGFLWTLQSGPLTAVINNPTGSSTIITFVESGTYTFQLKVTDNNGAVGYDIMTVVISPLVGGDNGAITFSLDTSSHVSLGVFGYDSVLVKTVFSDSVMAAGTHTVYWNKTNDLGQPIAFPAPKYVAKVLSNNVQHTWLGTIGNNSSSMTGDTKHRGYYRCMAGLVFANGFGYYITGYPEQSPSFYKFAIAAPKVKLDIYGSRINTGDLGYIASDGTNVYLAGYDPNTSNNSFAFAIRVSDDTEVQFAAGLPFNSVNGRDYPKAISIVNKANANPTGIAVEKIGTNLFIARGGVNELNVLNKTTGADIRTLTYTLVRGISIDPTAATLWMITGTNTVTKHTINGDGTLSAPLLTLSGLVNPQCTQVSPDGTLVAVADGGSSQQVKFFNNATGVATNTLGTAGGYNGSPAVTNTKFYFTDVNGRNKGANFLTSCIAFQPDGSFWVNDPGNFRAMHYTSGRTYVENLAWLGASYWTYLDKNNTSRLFTGHIEYEIDYTRPLTDSLSWTLKNNWGYNSDITLWERAPKYHQTLSNGKTFAFIRRISNARWEVVELTSTGYRFTGRFTAGLGQYLADDESLQEWSVSGTTGTLRRYPRTGYTGLGEPVWSITPQILAVTTISDALVGSPFVGPNSQAFTTANNKVVFYNNFGYANISTKLKTSGYHVGIVTKGTSTILGQTEKSTYDNYRGSYPLPGWHDVGNLTRENTGSSMVLLDRSFFTGYKGEFWKNGQTNYFNHYWDNGLAIGQFGTDRSITGLGNHAVAEMAGNALAPTGIIVGQDRYIFHGDESDHSGLHAWKVTRMNTIRQQNIIIQYPSAYSAPTQNFTELTAGLPYDDTLKNNTAGWTKNPVYNVLTNEFTDYFKVQSRVKTYERFHPGDVFVTFAANYNSSKWVNRDLGTISASNDWTVSGKVSWGGEANNNATYTYIRVLDGTGKVIARMNVTEASGINTVYGNNSAIVTLPRPEMSFITGVLRPFSITYNAGSVTFTYDNYTPVTVAKFDATANGLQPKTLQIFFGSQTGMGAMNGKSVDIAAPRIYVDVL